MGILGIADRVLGAFERLMDVIVDVVMFMIMIIVVVDVASRYLFHSPLGWSYELIGLYLMVVLFFFALAPALSAHAHVSVDLLHGLMSTRLRHLCDAIGYVCACVVFAGIVYMFVDRTWQAWVDHDILSGGIAWPTWVQYAVVLLGSAMMLLRMVFRAVGHSLSALVGRSLIPLPPISGDGEEL